MNKLHLKERNITLDYDHFGSVFSVIINRDVSAQPIGFQDAIRIQMKRTPVLSLILVYPFYLGTHSSLITMGQRSGGTKPCGWYFCKWQKTKTCLFDSVGANEAQVDKLRMRKSGPKCSSSCSWDSTWPQVGLSPQWAPARRSAAVFTTIWVMDQRPGKGDGKRNYFMFKRSHFLVCAQRRIFFDGQSLSIYEDRCLHRNEHVYKR